MRNTNVGDARKLGLLPSVTSIIKILDKPNLTAWLQEQAVLAAITLPRVHGESDTEFAARAVKDSKEQVTNAANIGTLIHRAAEEFLVTGVKNPDPLVAKLVEPFFEWANKNILDIKLVEATLVSNDGYAGRLDLLADFAGAGTCYADFKSRKATDGKIRSYPEDGYQLAAYRAAGVDSASGCLSILINSQEGQDPITHAWEKEEIENAEKVFFHCFEIWKLTRSYDPSKHIKY